MSVTEQIDQVAGLVADARRIIVFTGAGVSTESGIPDFRGPDGLWSRYDPDDFTIERFLSDREVRKKHWQLLTGNEFMVADAKPNPAHYAITELQSMGKLYGIITQNVDGLHQKAGVPEELVFELHGDLSHAKCLKCRLRFPIQEVKRWLSPGVDEPRCPTCSGMLKPDAVFFGEELPLDVMMESESRSRSCDLCIVLGSTLVVYPAATMPVHAARAGAKLVIINMGPTALDDLAWVRIEGKAGEIMPMIISKATEQIRCSGVSPIE
jgi:NAD-dependent deacetylase